MYSKQQKRKDYWVRGPFRKTCAERFRFPFLWQRFFSGLIKLHPCNNYLCTYDLYSPVHNVLEACISITMASGRGLGPGIRDFFGPCEMASSQCRHAYSPVAVPIFTSTKIQLVFCIVVGHAPKKIIYIKLTFSTRHWPAAGLYILTEFFSSLQNRGNIS
jgi:hypothetical protein